MCWYCFMQHSVSNIIFGCCICIYNNILQWITSIWFGVLWTTAIKRTHVKLRLYFKIFSDVTCAIIFVIGENKTKIKAIFKVKIHSLVKNYVAKINYRKTYIFYFIKLYSLLQILIINKTYPCFLALWVTVSQTLTEKCLTEKCLTEIF